MFNFKAQLALMLTVLRVLHKATDLVVMSILPDQMEQEKGKGLGRFAGR